MKKMLGLAAVLVLLAACEKRTLEDDGATGGGGATPVPTSGTILLGDLKAADLNIASDELTVQITLDDDDTQQSYGTGAASGDFRVYTLQNDPATGRYFTAFSGVSDDESVQAVVVMDGGQFNRFFGGATATQNSYVAPAGGISNYAGDYVGLVNIGPDAPGGGVPGSDSSVPRIATTVTGNVLLQADFSDGAANGAIFNRFFGFGPGAVAMPELVLVVGDIGADGGFGGDIELLDQDGVGSYSGLFGGTNAASAAGVVELTGGFLPGAIPADGNEREFGIFILEQQPVP